MEAYLALVSNPNNPSFSTEVSSPLATSSLTALTSSARGEIVWYSISLAITSCGVRPSLAAIELALSTKNLLSCPLLVERSKELMSHSILLLKYSLIPATSPSSARELTRTSPARLFSSLERLVKSLASTPLATRSKASVGSLELILEASL